MFLKYRLSHHSRQRYADRCIPLDPLGGESEDGGRALFQGGHLFDIMAQWGGRGRAFIRALALMLGYNRYLPSHIQHVFMG